MTDRSKSIWTMNALLAIILALLGTYYVSIPSPSAYAAGGGWETDGIMVTNTASDGERLVLIDTTKKTIMIYRPQTNKFRLVGARSYEYDVQIEDTEAVKMSGTGVTFMEVFKAWNDLKKKTP